MSEVKVIGQMDNTIDNTFESANRVYDSQGISPTIPTCGGGGHQPKVLEVEVLGGMGEQVSNNGTQYYQQDRVYNSETISPALNACGEGLVPKVVDCIAYDEQNKTLRDDTFGTLTTDGPSPKHNNRVIECVAMRGRDPENPSNREKGANLEQRLEINTEGISNCITTVQKDNLVLESESIPLNPMEDGTCRCLKNQYGKNSIPNFESQGTWGGTGVVHVKQATAQGLTPCRIGGGGGSELPRQQDKTRKGDREWRGLPDSDNGEYP